MICTRKPSYGATLQRVTAPDFRYDSAGVVRRLMRKTAATTVTARFYARTLHKLDKPILRRSGGKRSLTTWLTGLPVVVRSAGRGTPAALGSGFDGLSDARPVRTVGAAPAYPGDGPRTRHRVAARRLNRQPANSSTTATPVACSMAANCFASVLPSPANALITGPTGGT